MNWESVRRKYPKAFDKYSEWLEDPTEITEYGFLVYIEMNDKHTIVNGRYLFDFFDEQGIYITIKYRYGIPVEKSFIWYIESWYDTHTTRTEAEEQAFEKAFEILENKLGL